ncbi:hypothetical protein NHX12_003943 [Muraenolepis orangiensis]|uniref:KIAA0040 n=1 Tax=Muraenolepis orangiensis TaxID=630683 RepID=A0A9Q0DUB6_9TELE|nr:hypothetical protein NHX12_003943 [Muraenolepis orangiensis]
MEDKKGGVMDFFNQLWSFATDKHNQGLYNTVCLVVVLALPLLVLLTCLAVCCHCCCRRCCRRRDTTATAETAAARSDAQKKNKKKNRENTEDLWISMKEGPMTPDRIATAMV